MMDKTTRWLDPIMLTEDDCFCGPPHLTFFLGQGSQFPSELWNTIATPLGVTLHCTASIHPQVVLWIFLQVDLQKR